MAPLADAIRRAAKFVDIPGAPLSLRLDRVDVGGDTAHLHWSFPDPSRSGGAVRGSTSTTITGFGAAAAREAWAQAQLEAAHRHKREVDSDLLPGVPYLAYEWSTDEAWAALLGHLAARGQVTQQNALVTLTHHDEDLDDHADADVLEDDEDFSVITYRIDPLEWTAYLNAKEVATDLDESDVDDTVPAATPMDAGLPLWASDELAEATGAWGPIIGLVDGELVGLDASGRRRDSSDEIDLSTDPVIGPASPPCHDRRR